MLQVSNTSFIKNHGIGRGSIILGEQNSSLAIFDNCTFYNNYAYKGGVIFIETDSKIIVNNSDF